MRASSHLPNQQQPAHTAQGKNVARYSHEHRNDGARQIRSFSQ